ncbi:MAG: hypothetical protein U0324_39770 [Polyangiales bacterium]
MTDPDIRRMLDAARAADRPADVDREALLQKILAAPAPRATGEGEWVAAAGAVAAGAVAALLAWPTPAPAPTSVPTRAPVMVAAPTAVTAPAPTHALPAPEVTREVAREPAPAPAVAARRAAPPEASPRDEGDEWQIIRDADRALREHAPDRALAVLARHAVEHPRGVAAPEVLAYRVRAYCMAGRTGEAHAVARELRARAPTSPAAYSLRATCAAEP